MEQAPPAIRRLCIAVDLESYSTLDRKDQHDAQVQLRSLLDAASMEAGLGPHHWDRQPSGDGELALLPPGIDETAIIAGFFRALRSHVYTVNRRGLGPRRLRLRVAMHAGITQMSANGFAGHAVVMVCRLCESSQLRQQLVLHPNADIAFMLSQQLYYDHVGHDFYDVNREAFTPVRVEIPAKAFVADTWVYVPDHPSKAEDPASTSKTRHRGGGEAEKRHETPPRINGPVTHAGRDAHVTMRDVISPGRDYVRGEPSRGWEDDE